MSKYVKCKSFGGLINQSKESSLSILFSLIFRIPTSIGSNVFHLGVIVSKSITKNSVSLINFILQIITPQHP